MRIVGGSHKGRRLVAPPGADVRPTSERSRESLFDILAHAPWAEPDVPLPREAVVLDAFAGTGALGLEALSRGATQAWFFETDRRAIDAVRQNIAALGETARCHVRPADATRPPLAPESVRLVFLDPPYGRDLAPAALTALAARGWLAAGAICVIEMDARETMRPPGGFAVIDDRRYGRTRLLFLRAGEP